MEEKGVKKNIISRIRKRDGNIVLFDRDRITNAIFNAAKSVGGSDKGSAKHLSDIVVYIIEARFGADIIPTVEQIQDIVEKVLIEEGHAKTAKSYILYRDQHKRIREIKSSLLDISNTMNGYLDRADWRVNENSNVGFSIGGLILYTSGKITSNYWLNNIYPPTIAEAHKGGDFHVHDLSMFTAYCAGWSLKQLLIDGFGGIPGYLQTKPPKHLDTVIGQAVNFLGTLQNEWAGAQAFSFSPETPIIIRRNGHVETLTLEKLYREYKHHEKRFAKFNAIFLENPHRRYYLEDVDRAKYYRSNKLPLEPLLFQIDNIEVLSKRGFVPLNAITKHKSGGKDDILLQIETEDGRILSVSSAHPMILKNKKKNTRADKLKEGDELILGNIPQLFDFTQNKIKLDKDFSWLIGILIAEGCWGHQTREYTIVSQKKNKPIRKKIEKVLKKLCIPYRENGKFNIIFGTTSIGRFIRNHLKLQDKCFRKNFPEFIFQLDYESLGALVSGYIDGDGENEKNKQVRIHTTSLTLVTQLKNILDCLNINSTIRLSKPANNSKYDCYCMRFKIDGNKIFLFDESLKLKKLRSKRKESPKFSTKIVKIKKAIYQPEYLYDITTQTNEFLVCNLVVHNSSWDTYLAPFIKKDNMSYKQVKQQMQRFLFNMATPSRWGTQTPFINLTFDWTVPEDMRDQPAIIGGKTLTETYKNFQPEMDMINRAFMECMIEGDASGRIFTFPIPTYNITKDFDWKSENAQLLFEMTSKYGLPYFQNFINSSLKPGDVRSMCCRLQMDLNQLRMKTGGLFGSGESTGSVGVVTVNMPRLGYLSKDKDDFYSRLDKLLELAKESLEIKRKVVTIQLKNGLLPYTKRYLGHLNNHFATIGLLGMNEACLNFLNTDIVSKEGRGFTLEVLDFMREKIQSFQGETGNIYNLEATPAEGTSYRLAQIDKKRYPNIITAGRDEPFYTNSSQLPVGHTDDIFEALDHQDEIQCKYTGGTVFHGFIGEKMRDWESCMKLVKRIAYNYKMPYFTVTPTFSICPEHGYIAGEHHTCTCEK